MIDWMDMGPMRFNVCFGSSIFDFSKAPCWELFSCCLSPIFSQLPGARQTLCGASSRAFRPSGAVHEAHR